MKVLFLTGSSQYFENFSEQKIIKDTISALGHELLPANTDETMVECLDEEKGLDEADWQILCERILKAIEECDVALLDITNKGSFGLGYVAAQCLAANVPVMLLQKEGGLGSTFGDGLKHRFLTREMYNLENVTEVVGRLFESNQFSVRVR